MFGKRRCRRNNVLFIDSTTVHENRWSYAMAFLGLAVTPSLNPLRNRLRTFFRWRILPVPVVFLLFAFTDQLSTKQKKPRLENLIKINQNFLNELYLATWKPMPGQRGDTEIRLDRHTVAMPKVPDGTVHGMESSRSKPRHSPHSPAHLHDLSFAAG